MSKVHPPIRARKATVVADFIALVALTFGVGLAVSVAMGAIVVLLSEPTAAIAPPQARPAESAPRSVEPASLRPPLEGDFGAPAVRAGVRA